MARRWSGSELEFLAGYLARPIADTVVIFNEQFEERTYDSIQKKIKSLRDAINNVNDDEPSTGELLEETVRETDQLIQDVPKIPHVTAADKRAARRDAEEWIREVIDFTRREIGHIVSVSTSDVVRSDNSSLIVVLSDLHFGKYTNFFNLEVARYRLREIPVVLHRMPLPTFDEVVILLGGDTVEGEDIFATQNVKLECPVFEQTQAATEGLWETILLFRQLFNVRIRVETVPGNHGRMSKSAHDKSNWDNVIAYMLWTLSRLHGDPEIIINANYEKFAVVEVKDQRIGLHHKGVKHSSTPATREKINNWAVRRNLDLFVHGHYHDWHIGSSLDVPVISNGSLCGPDDLGEDIAKEDHARQAWFIVTPGMKPWCFSFLEWESSLA